jgi:hypothetical protein
MHIALATNLWIFGQEYGLMASNRQLRSIIEDYIGSKYKGTDGTDRPDLLLTGNVLKHHLLIEFKRPSIKVGREAEFQAIEYAETITGKLGMPLDILIVGGEVEPRLIEAYTGGKTKFTSYRSLIATARTQLEWLLTELTEGRQ